MFLARLLRTQHEGFKTLSLYLRKAWEDVQAGIKIRIITADVSAIKRTDGLRSRKLLQINELGIVGVGICDLWMMGHFSVAHIGRGFGYFYPVVSDLIIFFCIRSCFPGFGSSSYSTSTSPCVKLSIYVLTPANVHFSHLCPASTYLILHTHTHTHIRQVWIL